MHETSQRGVELLLFLAVSVRNDQDYGLTDETQTPVGALKLGATQDEAIAAISEYHPPYDRLIGFTPLGLRQAMNKIVHLNPSDGGFFADEDTHDLIVSGMDHRRRWLAVISLIDLCRVIKSVPDARTSHWLLNDQNLTHNRMEYY
jgi:hypothetical protein